MKVNYAENTNLCKFVVTQEMERFPHFEHECDFFYDLFQLIYQTFKKHYLNYSSISENIEKATTGELV